MTEQYCERCHENRMLGAKATKAVGQYFIDFKKLMWLCKDCTSVMTVYYGHELRERQQFERQFRALIKGDTEDYPEAEKLR